MLSIQNVILTKCNLYEMLPIQSVLYEMLPRQNVTIRKCTIQNVTDPGLVNENTRYLDFYLSASLPKILGSFIAHQNVRMLQSNFLEF